MASIDRRWFSKVTTKFRNLAVRKRKQQRTTKTIAQADKSDQLVNEHDLSATSNNLPCEYCMDLKKGNFVENGYSIFKPFSFRPNGIMRGEVIDCPYCRFLIDAMKAFDGIEPLTSARWELQFTSGLVLKGDDHGKTHKLDFYITPEDERSVILPDSVLSSEHVRSVWDDPGGFERLKSSLVKDTPRPSKLPTRVLDLGVGTDGPDDVRILQTPSRAEEALYATLSHCWLRENVNISKTLSNNIETRLSKLPLSHLPDTFKQTIAVCRRLGVRYLWIDSLCIIQDDFADWEREASDMANIYADAWFTIAMHQSTNGYMPFKDIKLEVDSQSTVIHVRRIPELRDIVESKAIAPVVGAKYELASLCMIRGNSMVAAKSLRSNTSSA